MYLLLVSAGMLLITYFAIGAWLLLLFKCWMYKMTCPVSYWPLGGSATPYYHLLPNRELRLGWGWTGHRVTVKITYGSKTFASNTDTFVFSLCYKLKLACCLENGECVPLETCVLSLLLCAFAVWHLENIGKTGHAPMPDKQNTKYISYSSSSIKVRIIKKSISWRGKCQKRKYNCSGSFPFPDFKVFVKSVAGGSINYWGWSIIGADTFQICAHMISPICRWYLWPHPLKAIDDMQSY